MGESLCIEAVAALVVWTGHPNEIAATWIPNFERVGQSLTQHLKKGLLGITNVGTPCLTESFKARIAHNIASAGLEFKQVKPGFTNYQPHPSNSWA